MSQFEKWIQGVEREESVPDVVKQAVRDTLRDLPDVPEKKEIWSGRRRFAVAAVIFVVLCVGVVVANPSLAANLPIVGSIFQKVEKGVIYSGEYPDANRIAKDKESHLSAQSIGIKLTASEVYCDGFSVYITVKMQAEQMDFSKEGNRICLKVQYGFGKEVSKEDSDIILDGKSEDKHTFIGMMKFDKSDVIKQDGMLLIRILTIYLQNKEQDIAGSWNLKIPYTVYTKGNREIPVNKKLSDKLMIKKIFVSPYQFVVFTREKKGIHSQIALFDQNGKKINFEEIGDKTGSWEQKIYARRGRVITKLYGYVTTEDGLELYQAKTRKEAERLSMYQFCVDVL